jgi:hypothetical protein
MSIAEKIYSISDIKVVNIPLTELCNMTCTYCPQSLTDIYPKSNKDVTPHDIYLKIVDYLPSLPNLEYVDLTDINEFFLTPELTTFYLPALKERGLGYIVAANGSVVPSDLSYYKLHNPKYLVLGLQTITEEQYDGTSRLKNVSFEDYILKASQLIKYFYENCEDTIISIEVACNRTKSFVYKLVGTSYNEAIPSFKDQKNNIGSVINMISENTGIDFHGGQGEVSRYPGQETLAHSSDGKIFFGTKEFIDMVNFYDRLPTSAPPVCYMEGMVFKMNGNVSPCCIDYKNQTDFGSIIETPMEEIFQKYVAIVNTMRTEGSPFDCCRNCLGYDTHREKIAKKIKRLFV